MFELFNLIYIIYYTYIIHIELIFSSGSIVAVPLVLFFSHIFPIEVKWSSFPYILILAFVQIKHLLTFIIVEIMRYEDQQIEVEKSSLGN